ncbi:hypothetical protein GOARA_082_00530 [Gordonia araii NBRC 100433]|uniref:Ig-like domain-containing protein n=1 Tax=Gordonia araii NBRC 100433 TaxID=1073574 RepID=G7H739_9ACTN|nr:hypothetical protein GOARA_082_00530 [Gordonia araii NBRC 100433]
MIAAGALAAVGATEAAAVPSGRVDPGVGFSSNAYGTGCSYSMTVPVDSSGKVTFWEKKPGRFPPLYIGTAYPAGATAAVTWVPQREGVRQVYAVQRGKRSNYTIARVHRGYGAGGFCFAL